MFGINLIAVVVAAVAAFAQSATWNSILFGNAIMKLHDPNWEPSAETEKPPAWKLLAEFVRSLVVAFVLAYLVIQLDISTVGGGLTLGLLAWIGFPAMILAGASLWENEPVKLMAIHAGDWLLKLLIIAVIVGVWQGS